LSFEETPSVVVFVADVARMSTFYRELASMRVIHEDEVHHVLEIGGFQLVIHGLAGEPKVQADKHGHIPVREDSYLKLCLSVESIAKARAIAAAHGGGIKSPKHEWAGRGFRACEGHDPEGNVIQVREKARAG
jgi:predicted enzyme related to lactoylglutathione lyase